MTLMVDGKPAVSTDGFDYSKEHFESFPEWVRIKLPYRLASRLRLPDDFETLGLLAWLLGEWPTTCLEGRHGGGQLSGWFLGHYLWASLAARLNAAGIEETYAIKHLRRAEEAGILWLVNRGSEILQVELRPL